MEDLFEHIEKAHRQALKDRIKANTIIIDSTLAKTNHIYQPNGFGYDEIKPMILGLEIKYQDNLTKDFGYNFILGDKPELPKERTPLSEYTNEELMKELESRLSKQ